MISNQSFISKFSHFFRKNLIRKALNYDRIKTRLYEVGFMPYTITFKKAILSLHLVEEKVSNFQGTQLNVTHN